MHFDVTLPEGINSWALRVAGFEGEGIDEVCARVTEEELKLPATIRCRYANAQKSVNASITFFSFGEREQIDRWLDKEGKIVVKRGKKPKTGTRIGVEISDAKAGRAARKKLELYSLENDGEGKFWSEHCALYDAINEILGRDGLSSAKLEEGEGVLTRRAIAALMELCERSERWQRSDIHQLFTSKTVAKSDRDLVARWLIMRFEADPNGDDQLGVCVWENAAPCIAEDLIRVIQDRRFGHHRGPLCLALAKTKDARAAEVIASVIDEPLMALSCLSALGKTTGAGKHVSKIKECLHAGDGDVRREAKKLLGKLGVPMEKAPPAKHLVRNARVVPKRSEEWSANLDMDELEPILRGVSECVGKGFAKNEIAEVLGVVEAMKVGQTRAFRFPVSANGEKSELWVVVFMDDVDAPDLQIHASAKIIRNVSKATREKATV